MTGTIILSLVTSAIGGGVVGELLRHLRERRASDQTARTENRKVSLDEFTILHQRCLAEVARLSDQVHDLEAMVVALSTEILNLGGDPFAIRTALRHHHIPHPDDQDDTSTA